jgi:hypothetical protein
MNLAAIERSVSDAVLRGGSDGVERLLQALTAAIRQALGSPRKVGAGLDALIPKPKATPKRRPAAKPAKVAKPRRARAKRAATYDPSRVEMSFVAGPAAPASAPEADMPPVLNGDPARHVEHEPGADVAQA